MRRLHEWASKTKIEYLGFGFLIAWISCLFRTDLVFSASTGININSSPLWLYSIGASAINLFVFGWWVQGRERSHLAGIVAVSTAVMSLSTLGFRSAQVSGSDDFVTLLFGIFSGVGCSVLVYAWIPVFLGRSEEEIEVFVPVNLLVTLASSTILSLLPAATRLPLIALLPICSSIFWGAANRRELKTPVLSYQQRAHRSLSRDIRSLCCFFLVFALAGFAEATISSNVLDAAGWLGGAGFQTPTAVSGITAIVLSVVIVRFSIKVDTPSLFKALSPVLVTGVLLMSFSGVWELIALVLVKTSYDCFYYLGFVLFLVRTKQGRTSPFFVASYLSITQIGMIAGSIASFFLPSGSLAPEADFEIRIIAVIVFVMTSYFVPSALERKTDGETVIVGKENEWSENNSLEERAITHIVQCYKLTNREADMLVYIAHGRSRPFIQEAMCLSKNTVSTHVKNLYLKTGVHGKQELIDLVESIKRSIIQG